MRAQFVFGEVWIGLRRNLTMTIALIVVVAISLSLSRLPQVASVSFLSQAAAYEQFKVEFANQPSFVNAVSASQIPASFQVRLKNTEADAASVTAAVNGMPGVDEVVDDSSILTKFYRLLNGARNAVIV